MRLIRTSYSGSFDIFQIRERELALAFAPPPDANSSDAVREPTRGFNYDGASRGGAARSSRPRAARPEGSARYGARDSQEECTARAPETTCHIGDTCYSAGRS